jgi:hypothetical protein
VASLASILYETLVPTSIGYADERVVNTKARVNRTLQDHLVDERRVAGITTAAANRYVRERSRLITTIFHRDPLRRHRTHRRRRCFLPIRSGSTLALHPAPGSARRRGAVGERSRGDACRYVLRPPFAQERLRRRSGGRVALELKTA